jgi:hypothetical protein
MRNDDTEINVVVSFKKNIINVVVSNLIIFHDEKIIQKSIVSGRYFSSNTFYFAVFKRTKHSNKIQQYNTDIINITATY